jgi:uncharacterized protein (TIGR02996 family)
VRALVEIRLTAKRTERKSAASLLKMVLEDPGADGPRQQYAEWLKTRGDPRGELIELQLARHRGDTDPARKKRERELLREHRATWLGPLAKYLRDVEFERGFLTACTLLRSYSSYDEAKILGAPEWSTVEKLTLAQPDTQKLPSTLRALRETNLSRAYSGTLQVLTGLRGPLSLESLHLVLGARRGAVEEQDRMYVEQIRCLSHLRRLRLTLHDPHSPAPDAAAARWLWSTELGKTVRVFSFDYGLVAWLAECTAHAPWVEELVLVHDNTSLRMKYRLRLGRDGQRATLHIEQHSMRGPQADYYHGAEVAFPVSLLSKLPEELLSEVVYLQPEGAPALPAEIWNAFEKAASQQKHAARLEHRILAKEDAK